MREAALSLGALALLLAGFALMALSQQRHWGRVSHAPPPGGRALRALRLTGLVLLHAALPLCIAGHDAGFGALLWVLLLSLAALGIALALTWRAQWLAPLARLLRGLAPRPQP